MKQPTFSIVHPDSSGTVVRGGAGPSPAQVAVYEHSLEVTWPGAVSSPWVIVSVNVFLQPYV